MNPNRKRRAAKLSLHVAAAVSILTSAAHAVTISGLYNTGVDNFNNALAANQNDPHYDLQIPTVNTEVTVFDGVFPIPPWVANNANSRWIGPTSNGNAPSGNYSYRTTFTLPANTNLSTVNISGLWSTDDSSIDIYINGNPTGNGAFGHTALWPFSVTSGFQVGLNTLDFDLNNSPLAGAFSPTGLRVDHIVGTYQIIVPEPGTACVAAVALCLIFGTTRRRRSEIRANAKQI